MDDVRVALGGPGRRTRLGIAATIVVAAAGSAAQLIDYAFFGLRIRALDSASNGGVFGVAGDVAVAAAAFSAWVLAARVLAARARPARWVAALAGLLTFLAADHVTGLHERISHWLAFYLPVLLASFACLAAAAWGDRLIRVGLALLGISFLVHVFGQRLVLGLGANPADLAYQFKLVVKHGTEVAGWLLIALGLLRLRGGPGTDAARIRGQGFIQDAASSRGGDRARSRARRHAQGPARADGPRSSAR